MLADCGHASLPPSLPLQPPLHMDGREPLVSATCSFDCLHSRAADGRRASANNAQLSLPPTANRAADVSAMCGVKECMGRRVLSPTCEPSHHQGGKNTRGRSGVLSLWRKISGPDPDLLSMDGSPYITADIVQDPPILVGSER